MPPEAGAELEAQQDAAMERLSAKLAKAATGSDTTALKEIVQEFYRDAVDLRTRNRELTNELKAAKGKVKEGDIVITGDDAKSWAEFRKLDIPAKDIPTRLAAAETALKENAAFKLDGISDEAAAAHKWNPKVLRALVRLNNLKLDVALEPDPDGEQDESGKKEKKRTVVVLGEKEDDEAVPLDEYVDEHLGDFRDALAGAEAARSSDREPPPSGPRMVRQKSGESGSGKGVNQQELEAEIRGRLPRV